jgi:hypothetical protein
MMDEVFALSDARGGRFYLPIPAAITPAFSREEGSDELPSRLPYSAIKGQRRCG